jgi:predicted GNAT superfamily acetyltransferase
VRHLATVPEFHEAVALQKEIWGFEDVDLLPVRLFVVAHKVGGQAIGAYDGDRMVGFLLAVPGIKPDGTGFLHSHMLGVHAEHRNLGVGRMLKLKQREEALSRGLPLVEWTFDPLQLKNAYFNIERLGAIVRRFVLNQYGVTSSPLQGGLPTDRCIAEWWLGSRRVKSLLAGERPEMPAIEARIAVPADIEEIKANDLARAREIQADVSEEFLERFHDGLAVVGFEQNSEAGTYLMGKYGD